MGKGKGATGGKVLDIKNVVKKGGLRVAWGTAKPSRAGTPGTGRVAGDREADRIQQSGAFMPG